MNLSRLLTKRRTRRSLAKTTPSAACLSTETLERRTLLTVPAAVTITDLEITNVSDNLASLTWEAEAEVDTYEVWVSQLGYGQISNFTLAGDQTLAYVTAAYGDWHRAWVRGINEDGAGPWGPAHTAIVGDGLPDQPSVNTWLDSDIYTTETTPSFNWSFTQRARQYDVWVEKAGEVEPYHRSVVNARQDGRTNRAIPWISETDMEDGVYRVWVRARNANGVSPWSASNYRAVGGEQPEVTGTTDSGEALRPTIMWSEGVQSVEYELWVSSEATGQPVLLESNLTTNSFTPTEDLQSGIYQAWVRQTPVVGTPLPWSPAGRFEVGQNTIPGTPVLNAEADPADELYHENLILNWDFIGLADRYEVWVADTRIGRAISEETSLTTFTVPLEGPIDQGYFRAWVRAIGSDGTAGEWSNMQQFRVIKYSEDRHRVDVG